ncbi:hypothetical protein Ahy_B01g054293 isoform E [Arachis hypogaea]|uniref:RecA-like N-terminal domain-containing protein n=1 Tax=Arachis hypogaea TaxID=3818 RepID=A0A445ATP3_ARAHY|nr:hypothetical protein Ahy_B01g054293 isoform E [Arachis hypogaea]
MIRIPAFDKLGNAGGALVETCPSGCLTLDCALGGGLPKGRIAESSASKHIHHVSSSPCQKTQTISHSHLLFFLNLLRTFLSSLHHIDAAALVCDAVAAALLRRTAASPCSSASLSSTSFLCSPSCSSVARATSTPSIAARFNLHHHNRQWVMGFMVSALTEQTNIVCEKMIRIPAFYKLGNAGGALVETFLSGCLTLDCALGGNLPKGRIVEIFGPESSGKTTVALHAIAEESHLYVYENQVLNACKNKLRSMDEVRSLVSLRALILKVDNLEFERKSSKKKKKTVDDFKKEVRVTDEENTDHNKKSTKKKLKNDDKPTDKKLALQENVIRIEKKHKKKQKNEKQSELDTINKIYFLFLKFDKNFKNT